MYLPPTSEHGILGEPQALASQLVVPMESRVLISVDELLHRHLNGSLGNSFSKLKLL